MLFNQDHLQSQTRRHFLRNCQVGLGGMALASLLGESTFAAPNRSTNPLAVRQPHFPPQAKQVIYLHLTGSPPNLDLFDYKPELVKHTGEDCPQEFLKGKRFAFTSGTPKLLGTPRTFKPCGESGMLLSDAIPNLQSVADDLCLIHSMNTDQFNHAPAELLLYTGSPRSGRPSIGSWVTYGLGTENENLPGFVVLISSGVQPNGGKNSYGSGFLSSTYQGVQCRSSGDPVLYLSDPDGLDREMRRKMLDALRELNELQADEMGHPETDTRIAQYELAFRMQMEAPEVMDITKETQGTLDAYGAKPGGASFANNCLLARRMVEAGVRYVQLFDWGWDFHGTNPGEDIRDGLTNKCATMDKPVTALINDLKQRGMLDETLIILGGEFGRTPFREGRTSGGKVLGRDHYPDCYTMLMAGGGAKGGTDYGQTDELGFGVVEDKVHIHDFQATIMHLLGFDHKRLTYRFQGRDYRLTDVHGKVVKGVLAQLGKLMDASEFDSLKTEAMARVSWGESKADVRALLMVNGANDQEADALIRFCFKQRGQQMRSVGMRNLILGASALGAAFVLGMGAWALLATLSANGQRLPGRIIGIAFAPALLAGGYGCWQLWLALDRLVFGAHADGPVE